jgi:hypothetical protein
VGVRGRNFTHDEKPVDKFSSGASLYVEYLSDSGKESRNDAEWAKMRNVMTKLEWFRYLTKREVERFYIQYNLRVERQNWKKQRQKSKTMLRQYYPMTLPSLLSHQIPSLVAPIHFSILVQVTVCTKVDFLGRKKIQGCTHVQLPS